MSRVKKKYFYYGAILNAILEHNPDASPTLILNDEETRQAYRILTNSAKQECILFLKYASCKQKNKQNTKYSSWIFSFSSDDKERLQQYSKEAFPVFICLLCLRSEKQNSEIAILKYEEYQQVEDNQTITIGLENGKHKFLLFLGTSKAREDAFQFSTTRVNKSFDDLAKESMKRCQTNKKSKPKAIDMINLVDNKIQKYTYSKECPLCKNRLEKIRIGGVQYEGRICSVCKNIYLQRDIYFKICQKMKVDRLRSDISIMEQPKNYRPNIYVDMTENRLDLGKNKTYIYIIEKEASVCPIHQAKMEIKTLSFGMRKRDTVYYCKQCKKIIVGQEHGRELKEILTKNNQISKYPFKDL